MQTSQDKSYNGDIKTDRQYMGWQKKTLVYYIISTYKHTKDLHVYIHKTCYSHNI